MLHMRTICVILSVIASTLSTVRTQRDSQRFEQKPEHEYFRLKGNSITLPCRVQHRRGECQWLRNNKVVAPIPGKYKFERQPHNGDCSITIEALDVMPDQGEWQCQVTRSSVHTYDEISSQNTNLVVLVAPNKPVIENSTRNKITVQADKTTPLKCQANHGNPPPLISWFLNNENITQYASSNVVNLTGSNPSVISYLNYDFKRSHRNSTIACHAMHQTVNQYETALIDVLYAPQVSVSQRKFTVNENSDLEVECQVEANPMVSAIWKSRDGRNDYTKFIIADPISNVLSMRGISRDMNNAEFECTARNAYGIAQPVSISLDVLYVPRLLKSADPERNVSLRHNTELFCEYDGNPKPTILWYHINPISDAVIHRPNSEKNASVLVLRNVSYHDEGHYYCEALNHNILTNKDTIVRSAKLVVYVHGKPEIIKNPGVIQGIRGASTDVEQQFCSVPPPTDAFWQIGSIRKDVKLTPSNAKQQSNNQTANAYHNRYYVRELFPLDKTLIGREPTCFRAIISIDNTDLSDEMEYTFTVTNAYGTAQSVVRLKVVNQYSAAIMVTIGLIILIMCFTLVVVALLIIRRRRQGREKSDDESKTDARGMAQQN